MTHNRHCKRYTASALASLELLPVTSQSILTGSLRWTPFLWCRCYAQVRVCCPFRQTVPCRPSTANELRKPSRCRHPVRCTSMCSTQAASTPWPQEQGFRHILSSSVHRRHHLPRTQKSSWKPAAPREDHGRQEPEHFSRHVLSCTQRRDRDEGRGRRAYPRIRLCGCFSLQL